jgi:hypothetical protein
MIKIIEFNISEIILAEDACSRMVEKACARSLVTPRYVSGLCSNGDKVFIMLEERPEKKALPQYRFALLSSTLDEKEISSEISSRFYAGFTTIGSFIVDGKVWGLFASRKTENSI